MVVLRLGPRGHPIPRFPWLCSAVCCRRAEHEGRAVSESGGGKGCCDAVGLCGLLLLLLWLWRAAAFVAVAVVVAVVLAAGCGCGNYNVSLQFCKKQTMIVMMFAC